MNTSKGLLGGHRRRRGRTALALCLTLGAGLACDTEVTNPGPILDEYIDDPGAHEALANGAGRDYALALTFFGLTGAAIAMEVIGSGNITNHGLTANHDLGRLVPGEGVQADHHWNYANRARFTAEEAARRIKGAVGAEAFRTNETGTKALIWAGYSNRMLGENACAATFDSGPVEDRMEYFTRAEAYFTEALENAKAMGDLAMQHQALAGRAAARAWLNRWDEAVADAAQVPADFAFRATYYATTTSDDGEHNRIYYAAEGVVWRNYTVAGTFYDGYYTSTADPRTPWSTHPEFERGTRGDPPPLFYQQKKYLDRDSPINIATGREMRYLIAEARLRAGAIAAATTLLNDLRAEVDLPPEDAVNAEEAWTLLKRERSVEFWLEGRRLGDIWRWERDAVPGSLPDAAALEGRDRCFPFSSQEIDANPNVSGPYG